MDPKVYEAVRQAVAEGFTHNALFIMAIMVVISGYLLAFTKRKAENLGTKTDFESLKNQLETNTSLTETIKQDLTKEFSLWQATY